MIFVANYKMNGDKKFYQKVNRVFNRLQSEDTVILCPPFVYMSSLKLKNEKVFLGAQDISCCYDKKSTGQISPIMLKEFDVKYTIVGHSERREIGENDFMVARKVHMAHEFDMIPIVCVGEVNKEDGLEILKNQVSISLTKALNKEVVFAYEPVWAIGTGEQPTVKQVAEAVKLVKNTAKQSGYNVKVLYGGSVNVGNYQQIKKAKVDGFLIGGVSLKIEEFLKIVKGE